VQAPSAPRPTVQMQSTRALAALLGSTPEPDGAQADKCIGCAAGKYVTLTGSDAAANCISCSEGKYAQSTGSNAVEDCIAESGNTPRRQAPVRPPTASPVRSAGARQHQGKGPRPQPKNAINPKKLETKLTLTWYMDFFYFYFLGRHNST
jgi:hypothetical protein